MAPEAALGARTGQDLRKARVPYQLEAGLERSLEGIGRHALLRA